MKPAFIRIANPVLWLAVLVIPIAAQTNTTKEKTETPAKTEIPAVMPCPQLALNGQSAGRIFRDGERITLSAALAGGDPNVTPTFVWSTSAGVISAGQGTRNLAIDSTGAGADRQMNVDLWVGGYAPECSLQANTVLKIAGPASKLVEFGELAIDKENEHLKEFSAGVTTSSDNIYVFGYAGRNNPRGFTNIILRRIKAQLITNGINYERLAIIDGGFREQPAFELWIVPIGAEAPRSKPTVAAKEIVFPKASPAKKP